MRTLAGKMRSRILAGALICVLSAASIALPSEGPPGAQALSAVADDDASSAAILSGADLLKATEDEELAPESPNASEESSTDDTDDSTIAPDNDLSNIDGTEGTDVPEVVPDASDEADPPSGISPFWLPGNPPKRVDLSKPTDGLAMGFGLARHGQLGVGQIPMSSTWWNMPDVLLVQHTGSEFVEMDGGLNFALGKTKSGDLYSWGGSSNGELGRGTNSASPSPGRISIGGTADPVVDFVAGRRHAAAVTASGRVYTWGYGSDGELGNGSTSGSNSPIDITANFGLGTSGVKIVRVSAEQSRTLAVASDGSVYAWGRSFLGSKVTRPAKISTNGIKMVDVEVGGTVGTYTISSDGNVYQQTSDTQFTEVTGFGTTKIKAISAGVSNALALGKNGSVFTLQNGWPSQLTLPAGELGYDIATNAGQLAEHALIAMESGKLYGFGNNDSGQLAWGHTDFEWVTVVDPKSASSLTEIPKTGPVKAVAAGGAFSLVIGGYPTVTPPPQDKGSISGTLWHDANVNGVMEAGEARIPNEKVLLFRGDRSTVSSTLLQTTWTDANGNYRFDGLEPANNYIVRFEPGVLAQFYYGWNFTRPTLPCPQTNRSCPAPFVDGSGADYAATPKLTVTSGQNLAHVNAGVIHAGIRVEKGLINSPASMADLDLVVHSTTATVGTTLKVKAVFGNPGEETLSNFVFLDNTKRGPAVNWQSCNGIAVAPQPIAAGYVRFTLAATLLPNRILSCEGTLDFTSTTQTHLDEMTVSATGATTGQSYSDSSQFEVTSVSGPSKNAIYIEKLVTGPTGTPVRTDGSKWTIHTDLSGLLGPEVTPAPARIGTGLFTSSLAPGPYWITETQAPPGHQQLTERIRVMVGWNGVVTVLSGGSSAITATSAGASGIRSTVSVRDTQGTTLPNAGGEAALWIPLSGAAVLLACLVLTVRRFRSTAERVSTGSQPLS